MNEIECMNERRHRRRCRSICWRSKWSNCHCIFSIRLKNIFYWPNTIQLWLMIECVTKRHSSNLLQLLLTMDAALIQLQVLCAINMFALLSLDWYLNSFCMRRPISKQIRELTHFFFGTHSFQCKTKNSCRFLRKSIEATKKI